MKVKQIINISIISLLLILSTSSYVLFKMYNEKRHDVERLLNNINVKDKKISETTFKIGEFKNYIKIKDTKHKKEVDSILNLLKVKPKYLIKYEKIYVSNIDTSTTNVVQNKPTIVNDSVYQINFETVRKCLKINGILYTRDTTSKIVINKTEGSNNIYIVKSYKKKFFDWVLFRKGKEITKITQDCGNVSIDEISIKK